MIQHDETKTWFGEYTVIKAWFGNVWSLNTTNEGILYPAEMYFWGGDLHFGVRWRKLFWAIQVLNFIWTCLLPAHFIDVRIRVLWRCLLEYGLEVSRWLVAFCWILFALGLKNGAWIQCMWYHAGVVLSLSFKNCAAKTGALTKGFLCRTTVSVNSCPRVAMIIPDYSYMVPSSVLTFPLPPPHGLGPQVTPPPFLLFASYWQHFWCPASYLLGLCSISDYQPCRY